MKWISAVDTNYPKLQYENFWNLPTASTNIFGIIVGKIIVLMGSFVHILIKKTLLNYGTFVNLHSLYHIDNL